jgi:hypothetical protein
MGLGGWWLVVVGGVGALVMALGMRWEVRIIMVVVAALRELRKEVG